VALLIIIELLFTSVNVHDYRFCKPNRQALCIAELFYFLQIYNFFAVLMQKY
jgi:hypothetical protein